MMITTQYNVPNLERALSIMELLGSSQDGIGLSEISRLLEFPKNSVFRITSTLLNRGYLQREENTKKFSLTSRFQEIGVPPPREKNLLEESFEIMKEIRNHVKETVCIGSLIGNEGVLREQVAGSYPFKFLAEVGVRFPLHSNAPGKCLLAFIPESERKKILKEIQLKKLTPHTITRKKELLQDLEEIRIRGYSLDVEEHNLGVHCVGAPIFNESHYPVASLWVTGPIDRLKKDQLKSVAKFMVTSARQISIRLGYKDQF